MAVRQIVEGSNRTGEEVCRLGKEIYERDVRALVEADHRDDYVAIDVETGCWALAETNLAAARLLREKQPDAIDVFGMRVGHPTLRYFGYHPPKPAE